MAKGFLEGFLFRPQGGPMDFPTTPAARISQFPYRHLWHRSWVIRYWLGTTLFIIVPVYWQIDKFITSPENKKLWKEKRKHDKEHHQKEMEKIWEVRT